MNTISWNSLKTKNLELVPHTHITPTQLHYKDSKSIAKTLKKRWGQCWNPVVDTLCGSPLKHCTNSLKIAYVEFFINFDTNIWFLDLYLNFEKEKRYGCYSYLKFKTTYHFIDKVCVWHEFFFFLIYCIIQLIFTIIYKFYCTFWYYLWVLLYYFN